MPKLKRATNTELIAELLARDSFVGIVIYRRGDTKINREQNVVVEMSKSPSLSRIGIESLLETTKGLVQIMFGEKS